MSALEDSVAAFSNPTSDSDVEGAGASDGANGDAPDAAKQIGEFREARERRQTRAALCVLAVAFLFCYLGIEFAAISKHMGWEDPQLVSLLPSAFLPAAPLAPANALTAFKP